MNYFAHGRAYLDQPYVLAGTAVPDWLNVVHRGIKARRQSAQQFLAASEAHLADVARGIVRHHDDDAWFHQTPAFSELTLQFTVALRELLAGDSGFRPSFLGHILVELLLDAALIEAAPRQLADYYAAVDALDPLVVGRAVNQMATAPTGMLAFWIPRFSAARFLYDYADDRKLLHRLNGVMRRVRLPQVPDRVLEFLPTARHTVRQRKGDLLEQ